MTGRDFGKYRIIEKIGAGGFGDVYLGLDPVLQRHVAIKTCSSREEELRKRFLREAEIAASLQHPNIITVFDFGYEDETPYLVQEYLSGEDLDHKIKRRDSLPVGTRIDILSKVAAGLRYAHSREVVHRDVKPANVRVLDDGQVKVMDFGIAKLLTAETQLTATGMTMGTAAYLPPEQLLGRDLDPRVDQFSFGVLAYELMTWQRPFAGDSMSAMLYAIAHTEPSPIASRCQGCPPRLAAMIETCLAKEPADRYPSFAEVIAQLEAVAGEVTAPAAAESAPPVFVPPPVPPAEAAAALPETLSQTVPMRGSPPPAASGEKTDRFVRKLWIGLIAVGVLGAMTIGALMIARNFSRAPEPPRLPAPLEDGPVASADESEPPVEDVTPAGESLEEAALDDPSAAGPAAGSPAGDPIKPDRGTSSPTAPPPPPPSRAAPPRSQPAEATAASPAESSPEPETGTRVEPETDEPIEESSSPPASAEDEPLIVNRGRGLTLGRVVPGEPAYSDRAFAFERVPEVYRGLVCVRTPNDQKRSKDWISFRVSRPVEVFVAHDRRIKKKPWWLEAFRPTGETVTVNEGGAEQNVVLYDVYVRKYDAGAVSLGENMNQLLKLRKKRLSMYTVFVRPE
ncbi:MAG: serine/threonine protein kinase [bacterium]|nr:serine/threonine protein kinase [bacterium]